MSFSNSWVSSNPYVPLLHLESPSTLVIFSLPDALDQRIALPAAKQALSVAAELARSWKPQKGNVWRSFVIYLGELASLVVVERRVRYRPRKYRGSQKFSRAFKAQTLGIEEIEVRRVHLQQPLSNRQPNQPMQRDSGALARSTVPSLFG